MTTIHVLGLDLAGPTNHDDTAAVLGRVTAGGWEHAVTGTGLDDDALTAWLKNFVPPAGDLVVGLDAPLSYNPGGGDRSADRALRRLLTEHGLASGTVMAPTMTRMAYLTLRGVVVARTLTALWPASRIVEVHPAGALVMRGARAAAVRELKRSRAARQELAAWFASWGMGNLAAVPSDHVLAAWAAALAAWDWSRGQERWVWRAAPPGHPFDVVC